MKVVKKLKSTVLLEEDNGYRFYVPKEVYETEDITDDDLLTNAVPYSLSFDLLLKEIVDFEVIQSELYKYDIHTAQDVASNRKQVNDILKRHVSADKIIQQTKL